MNKMDLELDTKFEAPNLMEDGRLIRILWRIFVGLVMVVFDIRFGSHTPVNHMLTLINLHKRMNE